MNIREYLENYNNVGDEIRRLNSELNMLIECRDDTYNTLKAQTMNDMPRSQRKAGDDVVSKASIIADRYSISINNLTSVINILMDRIDEFNRIWARGFELIDSKERAIIDLRYFQDKKWKEVAKSVFYCEEQCRRKADDAIQKLQAYADQIPK